MSIMASEYNNRVPLADSRHCHRGSIGALTVENGSSNHLPLCNERWQVFFYTTRVIEISSVSVRPVIGLSSTLKRIRWLSSNMGVFHAGNHAWKFFTWRFHKLSRPISYKVILLMSSARVMLNYIGPGQINKI